MFGNPPQNLQNIRRLVNQPNLAKKKIPWPAILLF